MPVSRAPRIGEGGFTGADPAVRADASITNVDAGRSDRVDVTVEVIPIFGCGDVSVGTNLRIAGDAVTAIQEPVEVCGSVVTTEQRHEFASAEVDRDATVELVDKDNKILDSVDITIPGTGVNGGDGGCSGDFQCAGDHHCVAGTCEPLNCGSGEVAQNHECVPKDDGDGGNGGDGEDTDDEFAFGLTQQEAMLAGGGLLLVGGGLYLSQRGGNQPPRRPRRRG